MTAAFDAAVHIIATLPTRTRDAISEALGGYSCGECGRTFASPSAADRCCED